MRINRAEKWSMAIISWKREGTVAVLSMDNGENRQNPAFVEAFLGAMNAIEADREAHAVVIASSDVKNWTQGLDLEWIRSCSFENIPLKKDCPP
jgi:enoyl-CoA hydratase/carnithine racemase